MFGTFTGLRTEQLFKPQYQEIEEIPVFVRVVHHFITARSGTARGPLVIGNSLSDSVGNALATDVKELAQNDCSRGIPVELHVDNGQNHDQAGTSFYDQAQAFLAQRFQKLPFPIGGTGIGPGITITPIPAQAS